MSPDILHIDTEETIRLISQTIRMQVFTVLRRRGAVVAVSGGVDSSICAALCALALGPDRVLALLMPERDSSADSLRLGKLVAETLHIPWIVEDITQTLDAEGCYRRQRDAIRSVFPDYDEGWKSKVVFPSRTAENRLNIFHLTVQSPSGETRSARMDHRTYLELIAATNFKQRTRKMTEYYHADRLHYAVCGTPNRLEYDQGFFVKNGDGSADLKPIAHLYKSQVYALAEALHIPSEITARVPTTDTFSLPQTQEEFYFALPYRIMDFCLYGHNHQIPPAEVADVTGLTTEDVERAYRDINAKRRATHQLHLAPLLAGPVPEVDTETDASIIADR